MELVWEVVCGRNWKSLGIIKIVVFSYRMESLRAMIIYGRRIPYVHHCTYTYTYLMSLE